MIKLKKEELFDAVWFMSLRKLLIRALKQNKIEDTFPNVEIALRIFLSMMVTNCSGERSFSKLKLIKNELRSTMLQERLTSLSLMSIECDILNTIDFEDVINDFAHLKSRINLCNQHRINLRILC